MGGFKEQGEKRRNEWVLLSSFSLLFFFVVVFLFVCLNENKKLAMDFAVTHSESKEKKLIIPGKVKSTE